MRDLRRVRECFGVWFVPGWGASTATECLPLLLLLVVLLLLLLVLLLLQ
jgi:hypothetical protein